MGKEITRNERLYNLRKKRGETQAEVAQSIGVAVNTYTSYETGQRTPSPDVMRRLSKHFGRTVQFLFFS